MLTLIIESSGEKGLLVLAEGASPLASVVLGGGAELSRTIAQEVKNLLGGRSADLVAVGIGPGSYTGIRVGVSLAKALAYGWSVPCLGFCSLRAFGEPPVLVDAKQGGIYAWLGGKAALMLPEDLKGLSRGRSPHPELIQKRVGNGAVLELCTLDPSHLAKMVWDQFLEEGAPPFQLNYCSSP